MAVLILLVRVLSVVVGFITLIQAVCNLIFSPLLQFPHHPNYTLSVSPSSSPLQTFNSIFLSFAYLPFPQSTRPSASMQNTSRLWKI
jgi:hypothetical protein